MYISNSKGGPCQFFFTCFLKSTQFFWHRHFFSGNIDTDIPSASTLFFYPHRQHFSAVIDTVNLPTSTLFFCRHRHCFSDIDTVWLPTLKLVFWNRHCFMLTPLTASTSTSSSPTSASNHSLDPPLYKKNSLKKLRY